MAAAPAAPVPGAMGLAPVAHCREVAAPKAWAQAADNGVAVISEEGAPMDSCLSTGDWEAVQWMAAMDGSGSREAPQQEGSKPHTLGGGAGVLQGEGSLTSATGRDPGSFMPSASGALVSKSSVTSRASAMSRGSDLTGEPSAQGECSRRLCWKAPAGFSWPKGS